MRNLTQLTMLPRITRNELIVVGIFVLLALLALVAKFEEISWNRSAMKGLPYGIELWVEVSNCLSLSNEKVFSQLARRLQRAGIEVQAGRESERGVKEVRGVLKAEFDCGSDPQSSEQVYVYLLTLRHWITKPATTWSRLGAENHPRYAAEKVLRRDLNRSVNVFISGWLSGDFSSLVENGWKKL